MFTHPQLEVSKGEAEQQVSTLLTVYVSQGENNPTAGFLSSERRLSRYFLEQTSRHHLEHKTFLILLYSGFLSQSSCRDLKVRILWFLLI